MSSMRKLLLQLIILLTIAAFGISCSSGPNTEAEDDVAAEIDEIASEDSEEGFESEDEESESSDDSGEETASEEGDEATEEDSEDVVEEDGTEDDEFEDEEGSEDVADDEFEDDEFEDDEFEDDGEELAENDDVEPSDEELEKELEEGEGEDVAANEEEQVEEPTQEEAAQEFVDSGEETAPANEEDFEEVAEEEPDTTQEEVAKTWIPVKKIKTEPFNRAGQLLNSVYIAREGDTVASVAEKIYGQDNSKSLLEANPHLYRGMDPGDKLYYNSPNRPNDNSKIMTYYEDNNIGAKTYTTQAGDNIRTVSANLLGFNDAWKEVWATNPDVESKAEVAEGLSLRYWDSSAGSIETTVAQNNAVPETAPVEEVPAPPSEDLPPPPPEVPTGDVAAVDPAQDEFVPPPPPPAASVDELPPPPPPAPAPVVNDVPGKANLASKGKRKKSSGIVGEILGNNMYLGMIAGGIFLLFAIGKFTRGRSASRPSDTTIFDSTTTQTQI